MNKGIRNIFSEVPRTYEMINRILTFGMDGIMRKRAARMAAECGGKIWLDVCAGTGDMTLSLRRVNGQAEIVGIDFSYPMLKKALERTNGNRCSFVLGDVSSLPFKDNYFDTVVISFATRNLNCSREHFIKCLNEFFRILKPGGVFINLETSQPKSMIVRKLFHLFVKMFVKPVGYLISGSKSGYSYLSNSIRRFYDPEELGKIISEAGFGSVTYQKGMFGAAAIHKGVKNVTFFK